MLFSDMHPKSRTYDDVMNESKPHLLFFDFVNDIELQSAELTKWCLCIPHALLTHFAQGKKLRGELWIIVLHANLQFKKYSHIIVEVAISATVRPHCFLADSRGS